VCVCVFIYRIYNKHFGLYLSNRGFVDIQDDKKNPGPVKYLENKIFEKEMFHIKIVKFQQMYQMAIFDLK